MANNIKFLVKRNTLICYDMAADWDGTLPASMVEQGFEVGKRGAIHHTAYRCPVNGDGYRYSIQEIVNSTGQCVKFVPYTGPGAVSGEI